ncbi:hypothetical protein HMN09_00615500 [Mycena chlorophos]|nr:hypothetical protein HMN09_00615500 [Mycena chlorophos]
MLFLYAAILPAFGLGWLAGSRRGQDVVEPKILEDNDASDSESEAEDLTALSAGESCKMVLVVRTDLGMTTGKIAAQ